MRWWTAALVAALQMTGCIINDASHNPQGGSPGDITFTWSFPSGHTCAQTPEAPFIHVELTGSATGDQKLQDDGWYNCTVGGADGIILKNFAADTYTFYIDAYDSTQKAKSYTATGTVTVNGDVARSVALSAINQTGKLEVYWHFGAGAAERACSATGIADATAVSKISVQIDGNTSQVENCTMSDASGHPVQGYGWEVSPGTHQVNVTGIIVRGNAEQYWYGGTQSATVAAGQTTQLDVQLYAISAGARCVAKMCDPSVDKIKCIAYPTCAAAGIDAIHVKLVDWNSQVIEYSTNTAADCDLAINDGLFWDYLAADQTFDKILDTWQGTYRVTVDGISGGSVKKTTTSDVVLDAGLKEQKVVIEVWP